MPDIAFVLIVITALLVVVGLSQPLAAYLRLPPVLLGAAVHAQHQPSVDWYRRQK